MQNSSARIKSRPDAKAVAAPTRFTGEILSVLSDIMSVGRVDTVLNKIASTIAELFSMRALVIGVWDQGENIFRVRATYGYSGDRDKKIRKFVYTHERLEMDLSVDWKIADGVFFIRPKPEDFIKGEEPFYNAMDKITMPRTDPSIWHELDYIRFVIRNREGKYIGFIEVNESVDNRTPDSSTIEAMQLFSQLAGVAIENATMFQNQVEAAKRSRFLGSIIAHDINNYNQAVTSYLQLALESKGVPEKTATYLERASSSAWGISELIQRSDKLIKIEEEGARDLGPVELGEVLKESVDQVMRSHAEKDVRFDLKLGSHRYFVTGNELANEIFTSILENAVTYDPHEKISVEVSIGEFRIEPRKYWCVSVADHGIGIPDSKKNIVFGRIETGDELQVASGLGLSIVRAIVEGYHGLVWVEDRVSGDPSKGSVFRVALPMAMVQ